MNNTLILERLFKYTAIEFEKVKKTKFEFLHKLRVRRINNYLKENYSFEDLNLYPKADIDFRSSLFSISFYVMNTKIKLGCFYITDCKRVWVINNNKKVVLFLDKKKGLLQKEAALFLLRELNNYNVRN